MAEDDPFVRSSVILRIESLGYAVIAAVNGNDALSKLRANPDDRPAVHRYCHARRHERLGTRRSGCAKSGRVLPVVFSSGYALEMLAQQGHVSAKSIILIKPYRKAELAERLRQALTANFLAS